MKIFTKLFLSILLILTITLSVVHYITVEDSFESALQTQIDAAIRQHRVVKYAMTSDIQTASSKGGIDDKEMQIIITLAEKNFNCIINLSQEQNGNDTDAGKLRYWIESSDSHYYLKVESLLSDKTVDYVFATRTDITDIYDSSRKMSDRYRNVFFVAEMIGAVFAALLALSVTAPIRKLTRASKEMAAGNYEVKIPLNRKDEIGELSKSFNTMKNSVTDTMDQLELSSRQKDDFVGNFAHELKTPMTSIIGYADTIYSGSLSEEEMREAAGFILNEGLRLESLSFKLLELITIKENKFVLEDTDASEFFEDTKQTVLPAAAKKNINITFECEQAYISIEYDLFKTMVMNLIDNAFKSGGDTVEVTGCVENGNYRVSIADNGRGIPKEELARITEAFYMIDKARSRKEHGAGLGLALCERVARLHGTKLEFISEEGKGTMVTFVLKICEEIGEE